MTTLSSFPQTTVFPQNENPTNPSSDSSFFKDFSKGFICFGVAIPLSAVVAKIGGVVAAIDREECFRLPESVYAYSRNICLIKDLLPGFKGSFSTMAIKIPFVEEVIFRIGLQETILKKIPKQILNRFAPSYVSIVDAKIAKIARVMFSALAFSLAHTAPPESGWPYCSIARLVNTFAMGLVLGTIQETTESPLIAMLFHSGFNLEAAMDMEHNELVNLCNF